MAAAAGFGLNSSHSRHANMRDQLNHARQDPNNSGSLIACRICDRVFTSSKALFDHIELHLSLDESAAKRQLLLSHLSLTSQRSLFANRFNQNYYPLLLSTRQQNRRQPRLLSSTLLPSGYYASSTLPRERNPFSIGTSNTRNLNLHSIAPSPISFRCGNYKSRRTTQPTLLSAAPQIMRAPQPRNIGCFTRPFLNQLEATLLVDGMTSFMDREIAGKLGDQQMLDVTLKLGREED